MIKKIGFMVSCFFTMHTFSQSYPPEAGLPGSTAIHKNSPLFTQWANGITVARGFINQSNPTQTAGGSNYATNGNDNYALGFPNNDVVSLGDGGTAILTFENPIMNGLGFDFAVFENGSTTYLELAFVEVSSDGVNFFRFPSHSQTQTATQIGTFGTPSPTYIHNLAGKYSSEYGTPFDISELPNDVLLDKNNIKFVKIIDVVGAVNPLFASYDSFGNAVNDSFPTPFTSCGFDLQGVGVINQFLSTTQFSSNSKVHLYPNPASDVFYVANVPSASVTITTVTGKVVFICQCVPNQPISVSNFEKGVYVVTVASENSVDYFKLVVE